MRRFIYVALVSFVLISLFSSALFPIIPVSASPLAAPAIVPTKSATIIGDDGDNKADPGEVIKYTVTLPNSGTDATGVTFTDIIDANTTLVAGSVDVSPIAVNDSYDTIGNTLLEVGVAPGPDPAIQVAGNVFTNDMEFLADAGTFNITAHTAPLNGTLVIFDNATGTFSYLPNPNFIGADTFTYTLTDSSGLTDTATVTINVLGRVWYVKNNAIAGGLGRSTDPFDTLVEAQAASSATDTIYVFQGSGATTGQAAGITLKDGQRLLGEGVALTVPVSVNGGANPTTLRAAGLQPQIDNTTAGGNGVSATNLNNIEVRGLNIAGNTNAIDVTTNATSGGSFEIANNTIRAAGVEGIDINGGGTGALTVNLHDNIVTSTGNGIDIQRTAGTVSIIAFDDNVVTGNTIGTGINIVGTGATVLFDANPGTAAFDTISGGATAIGQAGNGVGTAGLVMNNVRGDLSFTDLDIYSDNGAALFVNGTSPNYTGTTGTRVTANTGTPTLSAIGGPALDAQQVNLNLVLTSLSSTNSSTTGVSLLTVGGTFSAPAGSAITNATGTDFSINGNNNANANVSVTYGGTITDDVGALVQIQNVTAASTHSFTGAISDGNDGDGNGISLTNNGGAAITFSGGLLISTGANAAFTATGAGTVNVCDENPCNPAATGALVNSLTTTTGTALNVANTTIGANKLEFRSVSSNGAANGIVLDTTGALGGLIVNGTGANGTGGTIQNSTGDGVRLINTNGTTLKYMNISGSGNSGVRGELSTNVSLQNLNVTSNSNSASNCTEAAQATCEAGIYFVNMLGAANAITNTTVSGSFEDNIHVQNFNANVLGGLAISGCTVTNNNTVSGNVGIHIMSTETSTITASIANCLLQGNRTDAINTDAADNSTLHITITGNTIIAGTGGNNQGNIGIDVTAAASSTLRFRVDSNSIGTDNNFASKKPLLNTGINIFDGTAAASTMTGVVINNKVQNDDVSIPAGTSNGFGIRVFNSNLAAMQVLVDSNVVRGINTDYGILAESSGTAAAPGGGLGVAAFGVTNNDVLVNAGALDDIRLQARNFNTICGRVTGNNTATGGAGFTGIFVRQANAAVFNLEGGAVALAGNNPLAGSTGTAGTITTVAANACGTIPASGFIAMLPGNQTMAQVAQPVDTRANGALVVASHSIKVSSQASEVNSRTTTVSASINNFGGGKPLFLVARPVPALSGETVSVTIGTLPAGENVTIIFEVTVNNPLPAGTTQISNQGTVSGSNFANVLTDDPLAGGASDPTITPVDRPDTTVASINRSASSPTNTASVSWTVTFTNAVTALTSANFTLVNTGLGGAPTITSVTPGGAAPATQWTVTASTGTGDGTLGLNLTNDVGLSHDITNLMFTGQVYTIERTAPTVAMSSATGDPTNISPIPVTVQFSETVVGFTAGDIIPGNGTVGNFAAVDGDTYTFDLTPSGQGLVTADIAANVAQDTAGNNNTVATQFSHTFDSTQPTVTMSSAVLNPTNTSPIPVTVQFSETVTGFIASDIIPGNGTVGNFIAVDGDTYTFDLTPSGQGVVTADIVAGAAMDNIGNGSVAAAQFSRTYDSITPTTTITANPTNPSAGGNATFAFTGTDGGSGVAGFECDLDGGGFGACTSPQNYIGLANGSHTFQVRAIDNVGNVDPTPESFTWVVDSTAPDTTITSNPANPTNNTSAAFTFNGNDGGGTGVASFECDLDGGGFSACTTPQNYTALSDGSHTFQVRALDGVGNTDPTPASFTWVVDANAPDTTIDSYPPALDNVSTPTFIFSGTDAGSGVASFECRVDAGAFAACTSPNTLAALTDGSHTFQVRAIDNLGNIDGTPASYTWTIDTTAPDTTLNSNPTNPDNNTNPPFTFSSTDGTATFECQIDGGGYTACSSGNSFGPLGNGSHTFDVRAVDPSGNTDATPASFTWVVDATAPDTTITGNPTNPTNNASAAFTFSGNDGGGTGVASFECDLDGGGFSACTSPQNYVGLSDGSHTFQVRALDTVGNVDPTPASYTWTVDTGRPSVIVSSVTTSPTNISPISITITFSEPVSGFTPSVATGDLVITNGTDSNPAGSGATYTFDVTPIAAGPITVVVPAGSALDASNNLNTVSNTFSITWVVDTTGITIISPGITGQPGNDVIVNGGSYPHHFNQIKVSFSEDAGNPAGDTAIDDVTNPANYLLVQAGPNTVYNTISCLGKLAGDDVQIPTGPVLYNNNGGSGPFIATVTLNNGTPLPAGTYRLFVCGTTSIVDLVGNALNNGADTVVTFSIVDPVSANPSRSLSSLPATGFAPGVISSLPPQTVSYTAFSDLTLEIPSQDVSAQIVGVPSSSNGWDVSWLGQNVGYLDGTAFPTWDGNSVITGHVYDSNGKPGPFVNLNKLAWGQQIVVHLSGQRYVYEVRTVQNWVRPDDTSAITKHEELSWLTLITCRGYDEKTDSYRYRTVVRAVLVKVESEK